MNNGKIWATVTYDRTVFSFLFNCSFLVVSILKSCWLKITGTNHAIILNVRCGGASQFGILMTSFIRKFRSKWKSSLERLTHVSGPHAERQDPVLFIQVQLDQGEVERDDDHLVEIVHWPPGLRCSVVVQQLTNQTFLGRQRSVNK